MGNVLYFDAFNGVAGDMVLGALLDLGLPLEHLKKELGKLPLEGYQLTVEKTERQGLRGTNLQVIVDQGEPHSTANHEHHGHGRTFSAIRTLIESSELEESVRSQAVSVFSRLALAEAKVHGSDVDRVHFHEVGAVDAIIDIVGACIGFHYFEIDQFYTSPLSLGGGTVTFSHGTWPVPAPATLELVTGFPTRVGGQDAELTTPTGAAIVTTLAVPVDSAPLVSLEKSGLGAGDRELPDAPNMLRLILGQGVEKEARSAAGVGERPVPNVGREQVLLLEATIDDMDAEMFGRFMEIALAIGALDVFFTSIQMKKNRPGVLLSVLCKERDRDSLVEAVFRETTTLGIRIIPQERWVLDREVRRVELELGSVRVKVGRFRGEIVNIAPEYEDLKSIADSSGLPLKQVKQLVMEHWTELER